MKDLVKQKLLLQLLNVDIKEKNYKTQKKAKKKKRLL